MQDAEEIDIGHRARSGNEAPNTASTHIPPHRPAEGEATRTPGAGEKLTTTPRDLAALSCGCRNHRQLRRWVDNHLQQNPVEHRAQRNAGTLRSLLAEITRWNAPVRVRLACLEILRPTVAAHCAALTSTTADSNGSPQQTQEQRRDLLTATILFQHQALAYTSVCLQLIQEPRAFLYQRRLARALHRGIDSYRSLVQICSSSYLAIPKGGWSRMQRLVQLAREQQLDQRHVLDPLARTRAGNSRFARWEKVIRPYLQSALFASANPLQLATSELRILWSCCGRWASGATLQDRANPAAPSLLASLRLDQSPIPAARLQHTRVDLKHFAAPLGWSIDLTNPLRQVRRGAGHLSPELQSLVYRHVRDQWAGEKGRGGKRTPVNIRCQVVIGISAACHHLKQGGEAAPQLAATFVPPQRFSESKRVVMEVGAIDFRTGRPLKDYEATLPDSYSSALPSAPSTVRRGDSASAQKRYQPIPATLLNTSDSGAGLRLPPDTQGRLHSGDLIALWAEDRWEVALVRWHYGLPDQCRAGLEFLGGHTSAVQVHRHTRDGRRTAPMAGLLTGDAGSPPELVLPIPLFQCGDTVEIVAAGQTRTVTLGQRNVSTGSIAIFEFS